MGLVCALPIDDMYQYLTRIWQIGMEFREKEHT